MNNSDQDTQIDANFVHILELILRSARKYQLASENNMPQTRREQRQTLFNALDLLYDHQSD